MPLRKRKPFLLADPPKDLDPNELVYQVRFTKEIFRDYQEYLNRLNLYRQRLWTCKVTGKINLTYEEALVSEHNATARVQQFPGELVPHVLNMIQYSTLNLTDLIKEIHTNLQKNLYEGIELHAKKGESVCACKIIEVMKDREITQCKVGWLDKERQVTDISVVCAEDLVRKKPPFSRSILKAFIRESTCRISPWLVHEKLAKKHGILTDKLIGQNGVFDISRDSKKGGTKYKLDNQNFRPNQKKRKTENGHESENQVEEQIIYPIDDLLVKPSADDPKFTDRPSLTTDFYVPMDCVGDLLMVWNFFTSFGRLLHLWPFSLEDFESALFHKHSELMLILESHSAILKFLIKDGGDYFMAIQSKKQKLKVKLTNWAKYLCHFLEMRNKPELSDHIPIIKRGHYGLLDIHVKLGILRELVAEALITSAIRDKLDDCIEQNKVLLAKKREEVKIKKEKFLQKEGEDHTKEMNQERMLVNGKRNYVNSTIGSVPKYHKDDVKANGKVQSAYRKLIMENGKFPQRIENKDEENQDIISINEQQKEHLEREIENLSIRTNCIGKDRNYNRYWFFRREGRLFVESLDSNKWGYYSTKEELDALIGSLNEKGQRERDLKKQLEKYYVKISKELMYQQVIRRFGNFNAIQLSEPAPLLELLMMALKEEDLDSTSDENDDFRKKIAEMNTDLLMKKAELLDEYFAIHIDEQQNLTRLPVVLDQHTPDMDHVPEFLLSLGNDVVWTSEKECFQTIAAAIGSFYAMQPPVLPNPSGNGIQFYKNNNRDVGINAGNESTKPEDVSDNDIDGELLAEAETAWAQREWTIQHVLFPSMRLFLKPPNALATNGTFVQVASLDKLYKIFERC